jgi:hypothetical protein
MTELSTKASRATRSAHQYGSPRTRSRRLEQKHHARGENVKRGSLQYTGQLWHATTTNSQERSNLRYSAHSILVFTGGYIHVRQPFDSSHLRSFIFRSDETLLDSTEQRGVVLFADYQSDNRTRAPMEHVPIIDISSCLFKYSNIWSTPLRDDGEVISPACRNGTNSDT